MKLRRASPDKQRAASLAACQFALTNAPVKAPIVATALAELRAGGVFPLRSKIELQTLAEQLDEQYFELKDAAEAGTADPRQWQQTFAMARAVMAICNAGDEDPYKAAGESIYEAAFVTGDDNKSAFLALIGGTLDD
jgi:hypothetical protein